MSISAWNLSSLNNFGINSANDDLDNTVNGLFADINREAEMRNCHVDLNAWEDGADKKW